MKMIRRDEPRAERASRGLSVNRRPSDLARAFSDFLNLEWDPFAAPLDVDWAPPVDLYDTKDAVMVKADLPGVDQKDVHVSVDNGVLTIRGERKEQAPEGRAYQNERFSGSFEISFTLPTEVKADQAKAVFKNGVLDLTLPKAEEAKPKKIEVQVQG